MTTITRSRSTTVRPPLRLRSVRAVWLSWAIVQVFWVSVIAISRTPTEDIGYYFRGLHPELDPHAQLDSTPSLSEYPDAGVWPLRLIDLVTPTNNTAFVIGFVATIVALSAAFLSFLIYLGRRSSATGSLDAPTYWIFFSAAAGPILLTRLDLFPGLLVALTVAFLFTRPRVASALLGLATMSKLWPGVLAAALVGKWNNRSTWTRLVWFALSLVVTAGITIATSGFERLTSPLSYQGDRGLQVESIAATPLALANSFNKDGWVIEYAASKSYEIFGPGVSAGIVVSNVLMLATLALALGVACGRFVRGGWTPDKAATFFLLLVVLLIVSNKVFSPQYLTWFGPLLAVVLAVMPTHGLGKIPRVAIIIAAMTTLLYPFLYSQLVFGPNPVVALILAARNVLMIYLAFLCGRLALRR